MRLHRKKSIWNLKYIISQSLCKLTNITNTVNQNNINFFPLQLRGLVQERLNFLEKIQRHIGDPKPNEDELNLVVDSFRVILVN